MGEEAGYATDPRYAYRLIDIIELYELHKYDTKDGIKWMKEFPNRISLIWLMIYSILWYVRGIHLKNFLKNLISVNAS